MDMLLPEKVEGGALVERASAVLGAAHPRCIHLRMDFITVYWKNVAGPGFIRGRFFVALAEKFLKMMKKALHNRAAYINMY